jgi:effector-binding domain-containing protein
MKKWFLLLPAIIILSAISIYFIIPSKIVISTLNTAEATIGSEFRYLNQEEKWTKWWRDADGKPHAPGQPFRYDHASFRLSNQAPNVAGIVIEQDGFKLASVLHLVSFSKDTTAAFWQVEMPVTYNPVSRLKNYRIALKIKRNMNHVMKNLSSFLANPQNVYGSIFYTTSTRDTTMLSSRFTSSTYPTTADIYGYLAILEKNIQKQHGTKTGYPMINVRKLETGEYETQAAIPTNRLLENDGKIVYRRMVPGNFVMTEIKGGPSTVEEALRQLDNYIRDTEKQIMANHFQLLVTDRMNEPDTSKWITRLYVPVVK